MNTRELLVALPAVVGFFVVLLALIQRSRQGHGMHVRRFDLLVEALRDPALDPATRAELLRAVARQHTGIFGTLWHWLQQPMLWKVLWFGAGWMTMLLSGAALLTYAMGMNMVRSYELPAAVMSCALGFAMLTLPLALRELLRREQTASR